jgi:NADPH-dependent 2,4-dienoyl-CoA reductase/sulfur reductase-like enzyme/peroxiredoxin family protein/TusA-related sulfurtransferase/rhodanese-related sulfurtransferase
MNKKLRLVVVGGVAAGAAAAARSRRLSEKAEIVILEKGPDVSFANCGLPYYIGEEIKDRSRLSVQTAESLKSLLNLDVRVNQEVISIDPVRKQVEVKNLQNKEIYQLTYDKLVLAPGATPLRPSIPGIEDSRIFTLRNLKDMDKIKELSETASSVLVVGAGFIGLEMVEAFRNLGKQVTLVELQDQVLPQMDKEMTQGILRALRDNEVELILGDGISSFKSSPDKVSAILGSGKMIEADLVLLSIGVRPDSDLASKAGLQLGERGAIVVDEFMRTSYPDIYAAGDVVETRDRVFSRPINLALGGPANRQGRVIADHIFMEDKALPYPGSLGTAIVRVFDEVAALTGWTEKRLKQFKIAYRTTTVTDFHHAQYYPGALPITLKILWSPEDLRVLGAQCFGVDGIDKRIDVISTAIAGSMTIKDLAHLELAYAPPFGAAKDVLNIAGFSALNLSFDLLEPVYEMPDDPAIQIIDPRPKLKADLSPLKGAICMPLGQIREKLLDLDKSREYLTVCDLGKMSYFAARIMSQAGFKVKSLSGGMKAQETLKSSVELELEEQSKPSFKESMKKLSSNFEAQIVKLDATGISCPGPIMKIREEADKLKSGQILEVSATDPGFRNDIPAFCKMNNFEVLEITSERGIHRALIRKLNSCISSLDQGFNLSQSKTGGSTLACFSSDMDKVMACLTIANGAAALGGPVTIFFTFWGLNALRKSNYEAKGKGFMDKMFGMMMPRGLDRLSLSKMNFGGAGTQMMKWRMSSKNLPTLESLMQDALKNKVRFVACSMSMDAMGIKAEELIDGVEIGGAAEFVSEAQESRMTLFI